MSGLPNKGPIPVWLVNNCKYVLVRFSMTNLI